MDVISSQEIKKLIQYPGSPTLSIFMPVQRGGAEAVRNPARLTNLLRKAGRRMTARSYSEGDIQTWLKPAFALVKDPLFWQHPEDGLALFVAPGLVHPYHLPLPFADMVMIEPHFYIKPLVPLLSGDGRFYVLALSHNAVRLLEGTRFTVREIPLHGVPHSLAGALQYDDPQRQLQSHSGGPGKTEIFHGQAIDREEEKVNLRRFFCQIDRGLMDALHNESAPLVPAGVEYLLPIYREVSAYPALAPQGVHGNPEHLSDVELQRRAWKVVEPLFREPEKQDRAQYEQSLGTGLASDDTVEIVTSACFGRVKALFVAPDVPQWGICDAGSVQLHRRAQPGDEDLTNLAVLYTLTHGGAVYANGPGEMLSARPLAALFRF